MPAKPAKRSGPWSPKRWSRELRFTREGKFLFWITLGVGFAAINTGNNLLFLLLGMLLSMILASGVLSEAVLGGVEVKRVLPGQVHANTPCLVQISITNTKRRLPSYSIEVEDLVDGAVRGKRCFFLRVAPGRTQQTAYRVAFPRRGRYRFVGFRISTRFPFSLFTKARRIELTEELLVYPRLLEQSEEWWAPAERDGDAETRVQGRGTAFLSMRDFREGDDPRWIDWKATARSGRTMVKEFEREALPEVRMLLCNQLEPGGEVAESDLNAATELVATAAIDCADAGRRVSVVTADGRAAGHLPGGDPRAVLSLLATVDSVAPSEMGRSGTGGGSGGTVGKAPVIAVLPARGSVPSLPPNSRILEVHAEPEPDSGDGATAPAGGGA